jgi:hypothetical protein
MVRSVGLLATWCLVCVPLGSMAAPGVVELGAVEVRGEVLEPDDVSAIVKLGQFLIIGSDETRAIQVLVPDGAADRYRAQPPIRLLRGEEDRTEEEFDIEAMALHGTTLYVAGSHCRTRGKTGGKKASHAQNLEELAEVKRRPERERLFRVELDANTAQPTRVECKSLHDVVKNDPLLGRFMAIPSKENGIDIEGLAVDESGEQLYIGFRGPVFQGQYAPVLKLSFQHLKRYELLLVRLEGYGIRELVRVQGGFLVIAGPTGQIDVPGRLYFWDGKDCLPDKQQASRPKFLGEIPGPGKAEGLVVLKEQPAGWEILVAYDGQRNGGLRRFRVTR